MKLVILEGPVDLQFFKSFIIKQMKGKDVTKEKRDVIYMFKNLLTENPEMARVEVLFSGNEVVILLSTGSKGSFKIIAEGIKPLINALKKERLNITSILFIADKDAESEVVYSERIIREKLEREGWKISVEHILYNNFLEDLILGIVDMIAKKSSRNINAELLRDLLNIIEEQYSNDRYLRKRKVGIIHAIIGPRCFGHLFDEIFQFFDNPDHLTRNFSVLSKFGEWLTK